MATPLGMTQPMLPAAIGPEPEAPLASPCIGIRSRQRGFGGHGHSCRPGRRYQGCSGASIVLSTSTRLRLQAILERIALGQPVSLSERVYVQKFADRDPTVASWLRRARRRQQTAGPGDGIERLLADLDLGSPEPDDRFRPGEDDLGDWFSGAPPWLRRS